MPFDGTPKVIDACRECQREFKVLARSQGNPRLGGAGRLAGIRRDFDAGAGNQVTLKPVRFPALIPHDQVQGLPGRHVNPRWRESKIVHNDLHFLMFGGTSRETH